MKCLTITLLITCPAIGVAFGQRPIAGQVKGNSGKEPLSGAEILVKGSSSGIISDFKGKYKNIPISNAAPVIVSNPFALYDESNGVSADSDYHKIHVRAGLSTKTHEVQPLKRLVD